MNSWELVQLFVRQPTGLESVPFLPPLAWSKSLSQLVSKLEGNAVWLWLDPGGMRTSRLYTACSQQSPLEIGILDPDGLEDLWNSVWRRGHPQAPDRGVWALLAREKLVNPQPPEPLPEPAADLPQADFLKDLKDRFVVDGLRDKLDRRWELVSRLVGADQYNPSTTYLRERFYETVTQYLVGDLCEEFFSTVVPTGAAAAPKETVPPRPQLSTAPNAPQHSGVLSLICVDPIEINVGNNLVELVDPKRGAQLLHRVQKIRNHVAVLLGFVVPGVRFRDSPLLKVDEYEILLSNQSVARGQVRVSQMLALGSEPELKRLAEAADPQNLVTDPLYGMQGVWTHRDRERCEGLGMLLLDSVSIVASHLTDVCLWRASELFCYQSYCALLDHHKKSFPGLHQALEARAIDPVKVWQLLQELLSERVSIRNMTRILQTVLVRPTHSLEQWVEACRAALAVQITQFYTEGGCSLEVVSLEPEQEEVLRQGSDSELESLCQELAEFQEPTDGGWGVNFLAAPDCRRPLRDLLRPSLPRAVFLSRRELLPEVKLRPLELYAGPPPQAVDRNKGQGAR